MDDDLQHQPEEIPQTLAREEFGIVHALESLLHRLLNSFLTFARHMFYVIMRSVESRRGLISHLASFGILPAFHHLLLDLSPMGLRFGGCQGGCPGTEGLADRLLRLPFSPA